MKITEIRITLANCDRGGKTKLEAFCSIILDDCFAVQDLRVLSRGENYFVAMPSQKRQEPCPKCSQRNPVTSNFCTQCGVALERDESQENGKRVHRDIAHPINAEFRSYLESMVIERFESVLSGKSSAA